MTQMTKPLLRKKSSEVIQNTKLNLKFKTFEELKKGSVFAKAICIIKRLTGTLNKITRKNKNSAR